MAKFTTEVTSASISSDNPIHQRLYRAYVEAADLVQGDLLEIGCGDGRGMDLLAPKCQSYTAIDKNTEVSSQLAEKYPDLKLLEMTVPPLAGITDNSFDWVISFQVIEHIADHKLFLEEIQRVLKPGGKAIISTPNKKMSLSRNPWHVREYFVEELGQLGEGIFSKLEAKGIYAGDKAQQYYEMNKKAVEKITRWDILNMQYWLPAAILKVPYDILNRRNRNKLQTADPVAMAITVEDYYLRNVDEQALDLFYIWEK